jgi:similar to stage IV sporulation protein
LKNHWLTFFTGKILVKVEGKGLERVLNALTRLNISIWQVKRVGTETVIFYISLKDIHHLRRALRNFDCRVSFIKGQGTPFLWKRTLRNSGFLLGSLAFFALIIILSNMIWGIEIKGASPKTEHEIRKELDEIGVKIGKSQFFVKDVESIQRELSKRMDNITWVGVELKGTTYHFQVVEKNAPEEEEKAGNQNLVAKQKAIIVKMFVEQGQTKVAINDYVKKGDLLVSGVIGKDEQSKAVPAKGVILGQTWYTTQVELPLSTDFEVFTGREKSKHSLSFGSFKIPIWGWGEPEFKDYVKETSAKKVKLFKWELPISYTHTSIKENESVTRTYNEKEAIKVAKRLAKEDLKSTLSEDAEIIGEKILHQQVDNGKVRLNMYYKVIEDIAIEQPIIQGD